MYNSCRCKKGSFYEINTNIEDCLRKYIYINIYIACHPFCAECESDTPSLAVKGMGFCSECNPYEGIKDIGGSCNCRLGDGFYQLGTLQTSQCLGNK